MTIPMVLKTRTSSLILSMRSPRKAMQLWRTLRTALCYTASLLHHNMKFRPTKVFLSSDNCLMSAPILSSFSCTSRTLLLDLKNISCVFARPFWDISSCERAASRVSLFRSPRALAFSFAAGSETRTGTLPLGAPGREEDCEVSLIMVVAAVSTLVIHCSTLADSLAGWVQLVEEVAASTYVCIVLHT